MNGPKGLALDVFADAVRLEPTRTTHRLTAPAVSTAPRVAEQESELRDTRSYEHCARRGHGQLEAAQPEGIVDEQHSGAQGVAAPGRAVDDDLGGSVPR